MALSNDSRANNSSSSKEDSNKEQYKHLRTRIQPSPPPPKFDKKMVVIRRVLYFTLFLAIVFLLVILFASIDEAYTAKGYVLPAEDIELFAPANATISEILADEGDKVTSGQVLMRFDLPELDEEIMKTHQELKNLLADQKFYKAKMERMEKLPLPKELWEIKDQVEKSKVDMDFRSSQLERFKKLAKEDLLGRKLQDLDLL